MTILKSGLQRNTFLFPLKKRYSPDFAEIQVRAEKYANIEEAWAKHGKPLNDAPLKKNDSKNKNEGWKHMNITEMIGREGDLETHLRVWRGCHLEDADLDLYLIDLRTTLPLTCPKLKYYWRSNIRKNFHDQKNASSTL